MNEEPSRGRETVGGSEALPDLLGLLGNEQIDSLRTFHDLQVASQVLAQMELSRLSGMPDQDRTRLGRLEARLQYHRTLASELATQLEVVSIQPPEVSNEAVLIHGRVVDEDNRGLAGVVVSIESDVGQSPITIARATADEVGYYALELNRRMLARIGEGKEASLTFRSTSGRLLQKDSEPLKLAPGERLFRSVAFMRGNLLPVKPGVRPVPDPPQPDKGGETNWTVRGRVVDESGRPLPGLRVRLHDRENKFGEVLGSTLTDKEGTFLFRYGRKDFKKGMDPGTDFYLLVADKDGKPLYTSENPIRFNERVEEVFDIALKARAQPGKPPPKQQSKKKPDSDSPLGKGSGGEGKPDK